MWDFDTLHQVAQQFPDQSPLKSKAMYVANEIMNTFDYKDASSVNKCRKVAEQLLGKDWEKEMEEGRKQWAEGFKKQEGQDLTGNLWAVGHCHIDTAWCVGFT
jgi:alpha-mannosidase